MNLARVVGTLWATRRYETLGGATMQLIQPLTDALEPLGRPIVATDTVGAGPGELVLWVGAYEAVIPLVTRKGGAGLGTLVPTDCSIVGIVERWERGAGYRAEGKRQKAEGTGTSTKERKK